LAMYTFCVVILSNYVASFGYYQFNTFIMLFVFMISALVYLFLLFTPAIIMGLQKGIRWGIATFGLTVCWIIVALFLALAALFFWSATNNNGGYPSIIYPMTKGIEPVMMRPESVVK